MSPYDARSQWIKGPQFACTSLSKPTRRLGLVLLGPPGVGKGTQAALLSATLGGCHLSTGDMFRAARNAETAERSPALAAAIEETMKGHLVPDGMVVDLVRERVECLRCPEGFLLDGFPRTIQQADALAELLASAGLQLDAVLNYDLPLDEVVARIGGRRVCPACRAVYHVEVQRPARDGICDSCGTALVQREDDRPDAVRVRIATYQVSTVPLASYYAARGLLRTVPAQGKPSAILARTLDALDLPVA